MLRPLLGPALLVLAPLSLAAQSVRGTVTEEAGGAPVASALVVLVDASGARHAGALTDASGRFSITAPAPGTYTLRAERVGRESVVSPALTLRAGETVEQRLSAPARAVTLEGISVRAPSGRRCQVRPGAGMAAATLWEEARKALGVVAWARDARQFTYEVTRIERELEPASLRQVSEQRQVGTVVTTHPFQSIPADSLSRRGFVQTTDDGTFYYAPDAGVLLSETFLDDHCFRVAEDGEAGLVGLAFEPVRGRVVPEVRGTFWLDRASAELRYLEYDYVRLPQGVPAGRLGGRVEFERLPTGAWFVSRWAIRMPRVTREVERVTEVKGIVPERRTRDLLAGITETGAEVRVATRMAARLPLVGTVYDSVRGAPLAGAEVFVSGTVHRAATDAEGRFRIEDVPEGEHTLSFSHPTLALLRVVPEVRTVTLRAGAETPVALALPSAATVAAALCPGQVPEGAAVVTGVVRDAEGEPVRGARVVVSAGRRWRLETETGEDGSYRACGVPAGGPVAAEVRPEGLAPSRAELRLAPGTLAVHDVVAGAAVRLDRDGRPVELDEVRVAGVQRERRLSRLPVTLEEVRSVRAPNAYEALETLRPQWLRGQRGQTTARTAEQRPALPAQRPRGEAPPTELMIVEPGVAVFLDGAKLPGVDELRHFPADMIGSIEFLDGPAATTRFGTGYGQGAIVIVSRSHSGRRSPVQ
jgi:hypothetical protein